MEGIHGGYGRRSLEDTSDRARAAARMAGMGKVTGTGNNRGTTVSKCKVVKKRSSLRVLNDKLQNVDEKTTYLSNDYSPQGTRFQVPGTDPQTGAGGRLACETGRYFHTLPMPAVAESFLSDMPLVSYHANIFKLQACHAVKRSNVDNWGRRRPGQPTRRRISRILS
jgi:hypothetical protein